MSLFVFVWSYPLGKKNSLKLRSSQKGLSIRHLEFVFCNNSSSREAEISWPNWRFIENGLSGSSVGARFPIHCLVTSSHVYYLFKKTYRGITRIAKALCIYRHSLVKNLIKKKVHVKLPGPAAPVLKKKLNCKRTR